MNDTYDLRTTPFQQPLEFVVISSYFASYRGCYLHRIYIYMKNFKIRNHEDSTFPVVIHKFQNLAILRFFFEYSRNGGGGLIGKEFKFVIKVQLSIFH